MSKAYYLCCHRCRSMISAGQGPYCQDPDYLKENPPQIYPADVTPFLFAHLGHELGFLPETEAWDLMEFKGYSNPSP